MTARPSLDELPTEGLPEYLEGKVIQSDLPPPDFVDPKLVQEPDVIWRGTEPKAQVIPIRKRVYNHVDPRTLPVTPPGVWLDSLRAARAGKPRLTMSEALAEYADQLGRSVRPSNGTIAKALGKSREAVNRAVKALVADGWLTVTDKAELGVIVYALTVPGSKNVTQIVSNKSAA